MRENRICWMKGKWHCPAYCDLYMCIGYWHIEKKSQKDRKVLGDISVRFEESLVFQEYNLIDYLTTEENVRLGGTDKPEELLTKVNIPQKAWKRNVMKLSIGQQQRVAIARALASNAKVLLADEPTGNLDEQTAEEIIELLKQTAHELGKCVIAVTHSKYLANEADEVVQITNGIIGS